jgi:hypothetical protein
MTISLRFAQRARQRAAVADLAPWLLRRLNALSIPPSVVFFFDEAMDHRAETAGDDGPWRVRLQAQSSGRCAAVAMEGLL